MGADRVLQRVLAHVTTRPLSMTLQKSQQSGPRHIREGQEEGKASKQSVLENRYCVGWMQGLLETASGSNSYILAEIISCNRTGWELVRKLYRVRPVCPGGQVEHKSALWPCSCQNKSSKQVPEASLLLWNFSICETTRGVLCPVQSSLGTRKLLTQWSRWAADSCRSGQGAGAHASPQRGWDN